MEENRKRIERHEAIRTAAVIARTLLWIAWLLFDPRHL